MSVTVWLLVLLFSSCSISQEEQGEKIRILGKLIMQLIKLIAKSFLCFWSLNVHGRLWFVTCFIYVTVNVMNLHIERFFYFKLILSLFANDKNIAIMALPITRDGIVYFLSVFQEAYSIKMTLIWKRHWFWVADCSVSIRQQRKYKTMGIFLKYRGVCVNLPR